MFPNLKNKLCDVINKGMSRDTKEDFCSVEKVRRFMERISFIV